MATTERPVLVAVISTMGVIIAALITSGYLTRTNAARREDELEARIKQLEVQLRNERTQSAQKLGGESNRTPPDNIVGVSGPSVAEVANRLIKEKQTHLLSPASSVKDVIAENAMKEYVFIGRANVPLLFSLAQPDRNFWSDIEVQDSLGATVLTNQGFSDHKTDFAFTPPKDDAFVLRIRGTRGFGDFAVAVAPLKPSS